MQNLRTIWLKLRSLVQSSAIKQEIDEELRLHLEMRTKENILAGMSPENAALAARRRFGNLQSMREDCREVRGASFGETTLNDIRFGLRMLLKNPGFTAVVALSLALGIGANSALFMVINTLWLQSLPGVESPERLVAIFTSDSSGPLFGGSSYPDYLEMRDHSDSCSGLMAYADSMVDLRTGENTEQVKGELVTANYFSVLGVTATKGRTFAPEEEQSPGAHPVAIVSHSLWLRWFAGDAKLIGKSVFVNGHSFQIIGIAPEKFIGMNRFMATDLWVPMSMRQQIFPSDQGLDTREHFWLDIMGRLKPGATVAQAQANCEVLAGQFKAAYPDSWTDVRGKGRRITVRAERAAQINPGLQQPILGFTGLMLAVVGLVLLIACANVANLLLARAAGRRKEIAIRLSLGASRRRLIRQLLTESVLLAMLGGAGGLFLSFWTSDLLSLFKPPTALPLLLEFKMDSRVLGFTMLLSLVTGIVFGLAPALQASKPELVPALKDETTGLVRSSRLRDTFVVAQVALSLLLLIGAGLFLRSLQSAHLIHPGFDPHNVLLLSLDLGRQNYDDNKGRIFYQQLIERARSLPGVQSVSLANRIPLGFGHQRRSVSIEGYTRQPNEELEFDYATVGPGYFETMRVPLTRGRAFTEQDRQGALGAVIVNESFAKRFWPGQNPLGRRMAMPGPQPVPLEVVGVVKDGKYRTLGEEPRLFYYLCYLQNYTAHSSMQLLVRTSGDPGPVERAVRREVSALDQNLPVSEVRTLEQHMGIAMLPARLGATLLGLFGVLALLLAAVGIYGVLAHGVAQRTREIGIRMALGARRGDVLRLVLGQAMGLTGLGIAIGLALALASTRLLAGFLYGIHPTDSIAFGGITLLLGGVALLASYIPARRAIRVEPIVALRYE